MRTLLTAVALAAILTTPALADKEPVKPVKPVKPSNECSTEISYAMIMYHLDQIEASLAELEASVKPEPIKKKDG